MGREGADRAHPCVPIKARCSFVLCRELERPFFLLRRNSSGATGPTRDSRVLVTHSLKTKDLLFESTGEALVSKMPWHLSSWGGESAGEGDVI